MELFYSGHIVGVTFSPAKENLAEVSIGLKQLELKLSHIKDNKYDPNAIAVICKDKQIGWVPKDVNKRMIEFGVDKLTCIFMSYNLSNVDVVGINISVYGGLDG